MNKRDKLITLYLSADNLTDEIINKCDFTIESLLRDIEDNKEYIYTTQPHCLHASIYNKGYDINIINKDKSVLVSDMLNNKVMRLSQNWEKMLFSNALDIQI